LPEREREREREENFGAEVTVNSGCNYDGTVERCGTGMVDAINPSSFPTPPLTIS
jgi:hypothetical protein